MSKRLPLPPEPPPPIDSYTELARIKDAAMHGRASWIDTLRLINKIEELKQQLFNLQHPGS